MGKTSSLLGLECIDKSITLGIRPPIMAVGLKSRAGVKSEFNLAAIDSESHFFFTKLGDSGDSDGYSFT